VGIDNPEKESETMSRREFLKHSAFTALAFTKLPEILRNIENHTSSDNTPEIEFYDNSENQMIAYNAIKSAAEDFSGHPYSWETGNHHCSGYAAQYFMHLGFKIDLVTTAVSEYSPSFGDPMPNSTTVKQVPYLRMLSQQLGEDLETEIELKDLLSNSEIWNNLPPGTVIYLPERIGHHGYDTFTHVAIFMGRNKAKEPLFAEFSVYMKNGPQYGHDFEQFTRMYRGQNIEPYNPANGPLKVFLFDAVEASKRIKNPTERERKPYIGKRNIPHHRDLNRHQPY
jgi:hypothetical protein